MFDQSPGPIVRLVRLIRFLPIDPRPRLLVDRLEFDEAPINTIDYPEHYRLAQDVGQSA